MKKLKKYLLIIFISIITFLLVPRGTYALEYYNFEYNNYFNNYLNLTDDEKKEFINYLKSISDFDEMQGSNYVDILQMGTSQNNYILKRFTSNGNFIIAPMTIKTNENVKVFDLFNNNGLNSFNTQNINFTCNSFNNCTLNSKSTISTGTYSSFTFNQSDPTLKTYFISTNQDNFEYLSTPPNYGSGYDFTNDWNIIDSFSIDNQTTFNKGDIISSNDLIGNFFPTTTPFICNLQPLGVVKNVSSFTFEVTGIGNALSDPLKGQFGFVGRGSTPLLTNNYNISVKEKNNIEIEGSYDFQCNDEDIGNGCLLKYEYNYIDDIDTSLTIQFTFTSNTGQLDYEYSFYSCNVNNSKMNYTYIDNIGGNNQIVENPSLDNSINDDNVSESDNFLNENIVNNEAFNQDHGITAIIQAPINFLQSLSSKTCSNIVFPIPYLGNATIPCMSSIYTTKFNDLYNILKIIINGVLCYRMALSVVMIIKGAKDPNDDKIEVMDL